MHALRTVAFAAAVFWIACLAGGEANALSARLDWVEVDLALQNDGGATVTYKIRWKVTSGTMAGFYFQGTSAPPDFLDDQCLAHTPQGTFPLEIRWLGGQGKWDILLAGRRRAGPGELTYVLVYRADLLSSGHLEPTTAEGKSLTVLNWGAVEWDAPLTHETVRVIFPVKAPAEEIPHTHDFLKEIQFMTEPEMNRRYLISYLGIPFEGDRWFTVRFHRDNLFTREAFRIQLYVADSLFPGLKTRSAGKKVRSPEAGARPRLPITPRTGETAPLP
ncbi:MAG: hypothetical protein ACYTHM_11910 [Planctomycetota bacterium]|jgi:hypothetical protein